MKILFFSRLFYPHIGGVEKHVLEVGKRLVEKGHKVVVVCEKNPNYQNDRSIDKETGSIDGIKIYRIPVNNENRFKKFIIWQWLRKNRELINDADIVHCHDVFFWYLPFRFLYPKKPVYTTFHGYEGFPISKKAILIRKISEKLSLGNICIGDFIKKWYSTKPTYVSYGGINKTQKEKQKIQNKNSKLKIILIGRLEKDIGVLDYLNALNTLKTKRMPFDFTAYGDGTLRKDIEKVGKVEGFVNDVEKSLQNTDIVFASSYLTMLEALSFKKIIIAVFDNPLKEDYLRMSPFARYIFICKNADEIVSVVESIRKDTWKTQTMIENGAKWAETQTWDSVTEVYLKLWKRVRN